MISPSLPPDGDVVYPSLTFTVPPTPMDPDPTYTVMKLPVTDTDGPADKLIVPLLPADTSPSLIVTLPLTPLVLELTVLNSIAPELVSVPVPYDILRSPPKPVVPVPPLTDTTPTAVEPAPDANYRSPPLTPDGNLSAK